MNIFPDSLRQCVVVLPSPPRLHMTHERMLDSCLKLVMVIVVNNEKLCAIGNEKSYAMYAGLLPLKSI